MSDLSKRKMDGKFKERKNYFLRGCLQMTSILDFLDSNPLNPTQL